MATRARASNNQVNARSPDSDVGECRDTGRPGGSWDGLSPGRLIDDTEVVKDGQDGGQGGEAELGRQVMGEEEEET